MGIELKGWFVLAKEGEPSFRYTVTPAACAPSDLLVVFPWMLSEIISGSPKLLEPFISEARYAAEHRNYYWMHLRGKTGNDATIKSAKHQQPYPDKGDKFNDEAPGDRGGNFGRVARGDIMKAFIEDLLKQPGAGIPLGAWQRFFKIFSEGFDEVRVRKQLDKVKVEFQSALTDVADSDIAFNLMVDYALAYLKKLTDH